MQQSTQNRGQQRALATELDDQPRLLAAVLRAHMDTCEFTREKVNQMRQRARECPTYSMPTLVSLSKLTLILILSTSGRQRRHKQTYYIDRYNIYEDY